MSLAPAGSRPFPTGNRREVTPRVELDLQRARNHLQVLARQFAPGGWGGAVLDVECQGLAPLVPLLRTSGTWAWAGSADVATRARRRIGPQGTVVLDDRDGTQLTGTGTFQPSLVVVAIDRITGGMTPPRGTAALVDLTDPRIWRVTPAALGAGNGVVGFHLDRERLPGDDQVDCAQLVVHVLRRWRAAGRSDRPLLLLRRARTVALARQVIGIVRRACRTAAVPPPVMWCDVTRTVLSDAVRTVLGVSGVESTPGGAILDVDILPRSVAAPLEVLHRCSATVSTESVLLRSGGRLVTARVVGGAPTHPGAELAAPGWTDVGHPPVLCRFAEVR